MRHDHRCAFDTCDECAVEAERLAAELLSLSAEMRSGCDNGCLIVAGVVFDSAHAIRKAVETLQHDHDTQVDPNFHKGRAL